MLPPLLLRLFRRPKRPNYSTAQSDALRAYWVGLWWELEREREEREEREREQGAQTQAEIRAGSESKRSPVLEDLRDRDTWALRQMR